MANKSTPPTTTIHGQRHVAVFPFPFASHPLTMLCIVRKLAAESPNTLFSFVATPEANQTMSNILTLDDGGLLTNVKLYDVADGIPEGHILGDALQEPVDFYLEAATIEAYRKSMDVAVEESGGRKITCVLADVFVTHAAKLSAELNVPWICFWICSASAFASFVFADKIMAKFDFNGLAGREDETLADIIPDFGELRASDLPEGIITGKLESLFSQTVHKMGKLAQQATVLAINSFEGLEPSITDHLKPMFNNFVHIGPLSLISAPTITQDIHGCMPWLDRQEKDSVAYITFGTVVTLTPHELVALAEALEETGIPFLWSIKDHMRQHLPEGLLKSGKGKIVSWAPQMKVLAHSSIKVFITQFGWSSIFESVYCGVPMVGRPFFADNRINRRNAETLWKIGVGVRGDVFTKSGTIEALEQVFSNGEGGKMRENLRDFKQVLMKAIGPNGDSVANFERLVEIL